MSEHRWRFDPLTRKILKALIGTMKPQFGPYSPAIDAVVLERVERDVSRMPRQVRLALAAMMHLAQWGGPLMWVGVLPFTWLGSARRARRIEAMRVSAIPQVRMVYRALRTLILLVCYGTEEVQEYLGMDRERWREGRRRKRRSLLLVDQRRESVPSVPAALGAEAGRAGYLSERVPEPTQVAVLRVEGPHAAHSG